MTAQLQLINIIILICVMPIVSLPKTCWIFRTVSTFLLPRFWQNLIQYHCSSSSVIFAEIKNATYALYAFSLTLAAHDWRWLLAGKNRRYVHEGTLHLPSTPHLPCFISFRREKKSRILLNSPHILLYSFNPATWGHSLKDIEHVKIHVT
jgi:hypothetical protein